MTSMLHRAPEDDAFRQNRDRMVNRSAWILGQSISRGNVHSPEVVGVVATGLLERAWYSLQTQSVPVDRDEVIAVVAEMILALAHRGESEIR